MEGPTPVSTLLHSATLVIVGVSVYVRLVTIDLSGVCILYLAGLVVILCSVSNDLDVKKCAALSTCVSVSLI